MEPNLQHFYITEEQSFYLLSHQDAAKLKAWITLCVRQLEKLGYRQIELIGKGAFGFVFAGKTATGAELVFKFSRIDLPQHVQDRLEEESYVQSLLDHPYIPRVIDYVQAGKQHILLMSRAPGQDLDRCALQQGPLSPRLLIRLASQLAELLQYLRDMKTLTGQPQPIVHGDIKPSNLVFDANTETVQLVDWGSSVFSQCDHQGQYLSHDVMSLMSADLQVTNAKLGDVYFIGQAQAEGALSSPRFDEQGAAATLYALASGQSARFGHQVITPLSLGLPIEFARVLDAMMDTDERRQSQAADYWLANMPRLARLVLPELKKPLLPAQLSVWVSATDRNIDTVVYSSRKSFLREQHPDRAVYHIDDAQLDKYYKNYLQGMGATEKAFVAAVSRLGQYPIVGGLTVKWQADGIVIESAFNLFDGQMKRSFVQALNNMVALARALNHTGTFKAVMYNARDTIHLDRVNEQQPFIAPKRLRIHYSVTHVPVRPSAARMHSYFEDGRDPDEFLPLPESIMREIRALDQIHHSGCIIFEVRAKNLKIHNYYRLLDNSREQEFAAHLLNILRAVPEIRGLGIAGYMKMPFKDTRRFKYQYRCAEDYFPKNPRPFAKA